jgi:hypothetical protein
MGVLRSLDAYKMFRQNATPKRTYQDHVPRCSSHCVRKSCSPAVWSVGSFEEKVKYILDSDVALYFTHLWSRPKVTDSNHFQQYMVILRTYSNTQNFVSIGRGAYVRGGGGASKSQIPITLLFITLLRAAALARDADKGLKPFNQCTQLTLITFESIASQFDGQFHQQVCNSQSHTSKTLQKSRYNAHQSHQLKSPMY